MKKTALLIIGMWLTMSVCCFAQEDPHLKKMTDDLIALRKTKVDSNARGKVVLNWSASKSPKITLMDNLESDKKNEYLGRDANKFKVNQVVTDVYNRQNVGMTSKGIYFGSTEKGVFYSAVEKNVKRGCTAKYTLTGHIGTQEFVFVTFNPKANFSIVVNNKPAKPIAGKEGVYSLKLPNVKASDNIVISITNNSGSNESFVIIIHNPQK